MKYFFFDIDGTLKPYGKDIPLSAKKTIMELMKSGNKIFLATGRRKNEIENIMSEMHIENAVCSGGACIILNNRVEYEVFFSKEELKDILTQCRKFNVIMVSVGQGMCYTADKGLMTSMYSFIMRIYSKSRKFKVGSVQGSGGSNYTCIKSLSDEEFLKIPTQKLLFFNCKDINKVSCLKKYTIYNERIWKSIEFDFKEKGIDYIKNIFNLDLKDIVVFGDGINDISMFKYAENAIAMGEACSEIKELASFVTKNSYDDGIEYACKHFGWI